MKVLVVPSNRPESFTRFMREWGGKGGWDVSILVEDAPERSFVSAATHHHAWRDVEKFLGEDAWIFSRKDSAIRCFGFLAAWWLGAEHVLTLDDDCFPSWSSGNDLFGRHVWRMSQHRRWISTVPLTRVRGLPYDNPGVLPHVVASVGLWTGIPDLDARTQVEEPVTDFQPPCGSWVVPRGQYVPVCGMNLCFRRDALPLFYFPLMGEGQPYRRFDDIWAGVIAKKICDHLGWSISVGEPFVEHRRASDPLVNLEKEAPGVAANETFWEVIDRVRLTAGHSLGAVRELGRALELGYTDAYLGRLGKALQVWARLLVERPQGL